MRRRPRRRGAPHRISTIARAFAARAFAAALVATAVVAAVGGALPAAAAQRAADTTPTTDAPAPATPLIQLVQQDPWTPLGGDVTIRFAVANPPPGASVSFTVYPSVTSHRALESAVNGGALSAALGVVRAPMQDIPTDESGNRLVTLGLQDLTAARDRDRLQIQRAGVYPVEVALSNADDHPVSAFRTALVVSESDGRATVANPLEVAWVWPLSTTPSFLPNGEPDHAVTAAFRPEGRLGRQAVALRSAADIPLTLVPGAETLDAWTAAGHDDVSIQSGADTLRTLDAKHQILNSTYVPTDLPALLEHGLANAVDESVKRGSQILANAYGPAIDSRTRLVRPASAGALARLATYGVDRVVLDSTALAPPATEPRVTPAQPVTVRVPSLTGSTTMTALTTDPGIQALLQSDQPAALRAQLVLADLAAVALEQPSATRVITMVNPENLDAPSSLDQALLTGLRANPFLRPVTVSEAFSTVPVDGASANPPVERELASTAPAEAAISASAYDNQRTRLTSFAALTRPGDPAVAEADRALLASVSSVWPADTGRSHATAYLRVVDRVIAAFVGQIEVPDPHTITLTSRSGEIPLTFRNGTGAPVRLRAALSSDKLFFPHGTVLDLELPPRSTTVRVAVESRTSGTFPLDLEVTSTDGVLPISQRRLEVRSTFVSTVGIVLIGSAVLFLAGWWGVDLIRRRRRRTQPAPS